jgi:hypothetical protein
LYAVPLAALLRSLRHAQLVSETRVDGKTADQVAAALPMSDAERSLAPVGQAFGK